ncbi:MAG: DUF4038 domain-containing protein [Calditrichaeota bacterium]|nr:MAG: DUF4038 domain-containing protein [Calditrichota bacterium]
MMDCIFLNRQPRFYVNEAKGKLMKIWTAVLLISWFLSVISNAQDLTLQKWGVHDLPFKGSERVSDPFTVTFGAWLRHESGVGIDVPGFYNDDRIWILRFSPSLDGIWSYHTYSSLPSLAGKTGKFRVSPNTKSDRHGAIVVSSENRQRFVYEDGTPYFPLAFEIDWLFAIDADNPRDIPNTRQIVKDLRDYHFNQVIMNVFAYDAGWGEREKIDPRYNFAKPSIFPFGGANETPDHTTLNVNFFKQFDRVAAYLHSEEMAMHLMIYVWNKQVSWPKPGSPEDNRYFEYVVKRYQAFPNLIWDISKEALAYGMDDMNYIIDRIDRLRRLDSHKRLVTVHDYTFCRHYPDKVDFVSIQEWRPNLYDEMRRVAERHPDKPVFNVEHGGYEKTMHSIFNGAYTDADVLLERTYLCYFAGAYSTYYWQNSSWYELVYDPFSLAPEHQPHLNYYKILMDFFSRYNYNDLVPIQFYYSPYCLTDEKNTFLYLLPRGTFALEGSAPPQAQGNQVQVQWFNPLTGEYSDIEKRVLGDWTGFRKPASITSPFCLAVLDIIE